MSTTTTTVSEPLASPVAELYATVRQAPTPGGEEPRAMLTSAREIRPATR